MPIDASPEEIARATGIFTAQKNASTMNKGELRRWLEEIISAENLLELLRVCPSELNAIELLTGENDGHWFKYYFNCEGLELHSGCGTDRDVVHVFDLNNFADALLKKYKTAKIAIEYLEKTISSHLKEIVAVADSMAGKTP